MASKKFNWKDIGVNNPLKPLIDDFEKVQIEVKATNSLLESTAKVFSGIAANTNFSASPKKLDQFTEAYKKLAETMQKQGDLFKSNKAILEDYSKLLSGNLKNLSEFTKKMNSLRKESIKIQKEEIKTINLEVESSKKREKLEQEKVNTATKKKKLSIENERQIQAEARSLKEIEKLKQEEINTLAKANRLRDQEEKSRKRANNEILKTTNAYKRLSDRTNKAQAEFKKLAAEFGVNSREARKALLVFNKLDDSLNLVNKAARDGRRDVGRYALATRDLGRNLFGALGVVGGLQLFASVLKDSFNILRNFGKEQSRLAAILSKTKQEIGDITELTKDLGASTVFSASEATKGAIELAKAGFSQSEIMESLAGTLQLAAAGGVSLSESADIASNVLAGFGLRAKDTQKVVDVLAKSANSANVTIPSLGESFKEIASTAAILNVSIEEVGAVINTLGNAGIKGTKATNTLQSSLLRLADPPDKAANAMERLNLEFFNADGQFIGMTETISQLEDRFEDLTKEQQLAAASAIFGKNSANQWLTVLNSTKDVIVKDLNPATRKMLKLTGDVSKATLKGSDVLKLYTSELNNATDAGRRMSEEMLDNLDGDIKILKSTWEGFILSLEDGNGVITQAFRSITQGVTDAIKALIDLNTTEEELSKKRKQRSRTEGEKGEIEALNQSIKNITTRLKEQGLEQEDIDSRIRGFLETNIENTTRYIKEREELIKSLDDEKRLNIENNLLASDKGVLQANKDFLEDLISEVDNRIMLNKQLDVENIKNEKNNNTKKKRVDTERELTGLIEKQRKVISVLNQDIERADNESKIKGFQEELVIANAELDRLLGKQKITTQDNDSLEERKKEAEFAIEQIKLENEINDLTQIRDDNLKDQIGTIESLLEVEKERARLEEQAAKERADELLNNEELIAEERELILRESEQEIYNIRQNSLDQQESIQDEYRNREKQKEEQAQKERIDRAKKTIQAIDAFADEFFDKRIERIEEEQSLEEENQNRLLSLAEDGNRQAEENLALSQKREEELKAQREREIKNQQRAELSLAFVKAYLAKVESGSQNPVIEAFTETSLVTSLAKQLPAFKEGTDYVGDSTHVKAFNTGTDDFLARVNKGERIIDTDLAKPLVGMSNYDVVKRATEYNESQPIIKVDNNAILVNRLDNIEKAIINKPVYMGEEFDKKSEALIRTIQRQGKRTRLINNAAGFKKANT